MDRFVALILLGLLSGAASEMKLTGVTMFNCMRTGITCHNDWRSCVRPAGTSCRCPVGTTVIRDIHCVKDDDVARPCKDTSKCGTSGTCLTSDTTDTCYCDQMYYGDSCQNRRLNLTCGNNAMTVSVTPHGTFTGRIYAEDQWEVSACQLTDTAGTLAASFSLDTHDATNCGLAKSLLLNARNVKIGWEYTVKVVVQYNKAFLMYTDQELTIICTYTNKATVTSVFQVASTMSATSLLNDDRLCFLVVLLVLPFKSMI